MANPLRSVIEVSTDHLLSMSTKLDTDTQALLVSRRLLSLVQQRHSEIFDKIVNETCERDESLKEAVEQLLISLTMVKFFRHSASLSDQCADICNYNSLLL